MHGFGDPEITLTKISGADQVSWALDSSPEHLELGQPSSTCGGIDMYLPHP